MFKSDPEVQADHATQAVGPQSPSGSEATAGQAGIPEPLPSSEKNQPEGLVMFKRILRSNPEGAGVFREDIQLGRTPFELERPKGTIPIEVNLRLDGYETKSVTIEFTDHGTDEFELKEIKKKATKPSSTRKHRPAFELVPE